MARKNFEKHDRARGGSVTLFTLFIKYFRHLHKIPHRDLAKKYQRPLCMQNTNYLRAGRGHRDDEILSINAFRATPMSLDVEWQLDNNDPFFFNPSYPPPELPSFRLKKKKKGKLSRDYFTRINLKFADIDDIHDRYPRWI